MRIVCISDTHMQHEAMTVPDGDVLIHAGDATNRGAPFEIAKFGIWFRSLPHKHKLFIPGNHDLWFQNFEKPAIEMMDGPGGFTYMHEREHVIRGVKFYGCAWQPYFCGWAFNLPRGPELARKWSFIPDDVQVLITHSPPADILDCTFDGRRVGCLDLWHRLNSLERLRLHVFGHIHYSYGSHVRNGVTHFNACICAEDYEPRNDPLVFDL